MPSFNNVSVNSCCLNAYEYVTPTPKSSLIHLFLFPFFPLWKDYVIGQSESVLFALQSSQSDVSCFPHYTFLCNSFCKDSGPKSLLTNYMKHLIDVLAIKHFVLILY